MWEKLNQKARKIMILAQEEADRLGHNYLGCEHLLLGLIREKIGDNIDLLFQYIKLMANIVDVKELLVKGRFTFKSESTGI